MRLFPFQISASDLEGEHLLHSDNAVGAEVLEEGEMEPFVEEVEKFAKRKKILHCSVLTAGRW